MIIQSISYINEKNTGDMQSCPFQHFKVDAEVKKIHIMDIDGIDPELPVIIGGGGLLQHGESINNIEKIIRSNVAPVIIWGAGVNTNYKKNKDEIPSFIDKASLAGIRDYGFAFGHVPCASCMHPAFDKKYTVKNEIVCFEGNKLHMDFPTMNCQAGHTMEEIIEFLGSAHTIITSSYHGMYWGVLLGKSVIVIPNEDSSKFYNFYFNVPITNTHEWKFFLGKSEIHENALHLCRNLNMIHADKVSKLLNVKMQPK